MALISCPECNQQISDRAKACPHCGFDMTAPKCPECGKYLPEDATACPACGCPVETPAPEETAAPASPAAPQAPAPKGVPTQLTFPAPHPSWKTNIPPAVIMDQEGKITVGVVEWNKTVTITSARPETLSIRRNDAAQLRRNNMSAGIGMLICAAFFFVIPIFAFEMLGVFWFFSVLFAFIGVTGLVGTNIKPMCIFSITPGKKYEFYWDKNMLEMRQLD